MCVFIYILLYKTDTINHCSALNAFNNIDLIVERSNFGLNQWREFGGGATRVTAQWQARGVFEETVW